MNENQKKIINKKPLHWLGKHHSKKSKEKMSETRKGKHYSSKTEFKKGYKLSEETREKIKKWRATPKGKEATKKAAILGAKERWEGHTIKTKNKTKKRDRQYKYQSYEGRYPNGPTEKKRFTNQRYKAKKKGALGSHTLEEWEALKKKYNYMCLCCKRYEPEITLTEDHIISLDKGGSDYIENIQPLCRSCNSRKFTTIINYLPISDNVINNNIHYLN